MAYPLNGSNGELVKKRIIFAPPPQDAVVKITDTTQDLVVECAEVIDGGDFVIVRGHLNKSIAYLTTNKGALNKLIGKEEKHDDKKDDDKKDDDKKGKKHVSCEPVCPEPQCMAVDGVIRHTTVWIPFETLVSVEGAQVGDRVRIESLTVEPLYKNNRIHEIIEDCLIVGMTINDLIQVSVIVDEGIRPCNTQEYLQPCHKEHLLCHKDHESKCCED